MNIVDDNSPVVVANVSSSPSPSPLPRKPRGFAAMDRERVREISSLGGKAAHQAGVAHRFSSEEARLAGALGGKKTQMARRSVKVKVANADGTINEGKSMANFKEMIEQTSAQLSDKMLDDK